MSLSEYYRAQRHAQQRVRSKSRHYGTTISHDVKESTYGKCISSPKAQIVRLERYHDNFWEILWTIFGNCTDYPHTTTDNKVYRTSDTTTSPNTHDTALECDCTEKRIYRQLKSGLLTEMKQKRFAQELLSWQKVVREKTTILNHLKDHI